MKECQTTPHLRQTLRDQILLLPSVVEEANLVETTSRGPILEHQIDPITNLLTHVLSHQIPPEVTDLSKATASVRDGGTASTQSTN